MNSVVKPSDVLVDMPFPLKGLNVASEFELQPKGTTAVGENVRAVEHDLDRSRGASRPGLSRFINERVEEKDLAAVDPALSMVIQHLNIIVDPTTEALLAPEDDEAGDVDPSTNNASTRNPAPARRIRRGGSGRQPNRKKKKQKFALTVTADDRVKSDGQAVTFTGQEFTSSGLQGGDTITSVRLRSNGAPASAPASGAPYPIIASRAAIRSPTGRRYTTTYVDGSLTFGGITFIQGTQANNSQSAPYSAWSLAFVSNVAAGDFLLVAVSGLPNGTGAQTVTVTDSQGNSYTQIASYVTTNGGFIVLSLWRTVAGSSGPCTVTVDQSNNPLFASVGKIGLLEYSGAHATPIDATSTHSEDPSADDARTTGAVSVAGTGELLLGVFLHQAADLYTENPDFTWRLGESGGDTFKVLDWIDLPAGSHEVTATGAAGASRYAAIGVSIKPA